MASTKKNKVGAVVTNETRGEEMDEWWERKDHPLLNDLVLSTLFEFMGGVDLMECRLVCKQWCELSVPFARSKLSVEITENGEENTNRSVKDFVELFRHNKLGIPFNEHNLHSFCTTEGPGQEFLQICGNTVKTVILRQKVEDISELLKAMPNIESCFIPQGIHSRSGNVVKLFPDDENDDSSKPTLSRLNKIIFCDRNPKNADQTLTRDYCPTFLEEILSIAPNISMIKVQDFYNDKVGQVLKAIEKLGRESVITTLDVNNGNPEHFKLLQRLAQNGLKLKKLIFLVNNFYGEDDEVEDEDTFLFLPSLAKLFQNSIEHLYVDQVCPTLIQLPIMPKLKSLEFYILDGFDSKCVDLNSLCPTLKALKLSYWEDWDLPHCNDHCGWEWEELILPHSDPCPNVNSFILIQVRLSLQLFNHILYIFPKLTKLELEVGRDGEEILTKIMSEMTQLEDLSVSGMIEQVESIDGFLSGIPFQGVIVEHLVNEMKEMTVQLRTDTIQHYRTRYPSIANLTNLKRLHLNTTGIVWDGWMDGPEIFTKLTDSFAYLGLYSMKHINNLEIEKCELTKTGCEMLTLEMGLKTWRFLNKDGGDIVPEVK